MPYTVNARRGGEPARMLLSEFEEAKWNEWLGSNDLKKLDGSDALTAQLAQAKIAYLMGKGNKSLVPVIILHSSAPQPLWAATPLLLVDKKWVIEEVYIFFHLFIILLKI